ncbi:unnamed protein product [Heligmosomoides polygyrus]|uniref:Transposase n=1 Tax=Heligmosomoides polygyrus TaxID=6339 RepID=A0A183GBH7_HELPZ|nr:unnamed protein product [Heligmosomoides polygyrus]
MEKGNLTDIVRLLDVARPTVSKTILCFKELGHEGDRPERGRPGSRGSSKSGSVLRIAKRELGLKPYKLPKAHFLGPDSSTIPVVSLTYRGFTISAYVVRAAGRGWERILFTNEKLFTVEQKHNRQNHRMWLTGAASTSAIVEHRQNVQSVLVWAQSAPPARSLVFLDKGVKIDKDVYQEDILESVVRRWGSQYFGNTHWTFQRDSAP